MDKIKYIIEIRPFVCFLSHSSFTFSSMVVLTEICAPDRTPCTHLHPSPALCFCCFKSSTLGSWLCCFECRLSASHHNIHISWYLLLNSCDNASFIGISLISFRFPRLPLHEGSLQALEDLPFSKSYTKSI